MRGFTVYNKAPILSIVYQGEPKARIRYYQSVRGALMLYGMLPRQPLLDWVQKVVVMVIHVHVWLGGICKCMYNYLYCLHALM